MLERMLVNLSHEFGSGHSIEDLRERLAQSFTPRELVPDVSAFLLGWVKQSLDTAIEGGRLAQISYDAFHTEAISIIRKLDALAILASFAPNPDRAEIRRHLRTRVYVRQMELIDSLDNDKLRCVSDFLKAKADKIFWAARGRVHASSFATLEDDLLAAWQSIKTRVELTLVGRSELDVGKLVFAECSLHKALLQGAPPPDHFVRGSFHALSDTQQVGWHPRYSTLLAARAAS